MNILLADDEHLTRLGLKNMIEELYPDVHEFMEAADGEELLQLLDKNTPDFIFLDIHMPKLSGLEAYSQFSKRGIPVVMLTGYAEFSYAKEALKLGAMDYLLKPASLDEIKTVMEKLTSLQYKQTLMRKKDYELEFNKLLDLYTSIQFIPIPEFVIPPYTALLVYFDYSQKTLCKNDIDSLSVLLGSVFEKHHALWASSFLSSGEFCFISSASIPASEFSKELFLFNQKSNGTATAFYFSAQTLPDLFDRLEYIQKNQSLRFCRHLGDIFSEQDVSSVSELLPFTYLLEKIIFSHRISDTVSFQKQLESLASLFTSDHMIQRCDASLNHILTIEFETPASVHTFQEFINYLKQCDAKYQETDIIDSINIYVEKNYMNQIGINTLSDLIGISPNYLSKIYKIKTGENFVDHLTSVRIKKAIELIQSGQFTTIKTVAEKVGYFSSRYFTKVFLKSTGITPSEYIKKSTIGKISGLD